MPSMIHAVCRRGNHGVYQRRVYMTQNDSMNETYKRLLQAARELKSWGTPSDICVGLTRSGYAVTDQMMTNWKKRGVSKEGRLSASSILGIRPKWLEDGTGPMRDAESALTSALAGQTAHYGTAELGPRLSSPTQVPVVGTAQLGDNGFWSELEYPEGYGDGYVMAWTHDENAYAIRCRGDSMCPRIKDGEFVVVAPNTAPIPGDEVLVKHIDGRVMVKQFLYEREGRLHLMSINEAYPKHSFPLEEIELFHAVIGILKRSMWVAG